MTEYKYLGVLLSNKRLTSLITTHVSEILKKAERRVNCIRHLGFQRDGLRPATSVTLYKKLVRPILEYAAQVLSYRHYYYYSKHTDDRSLLRVDEHIAKLEAFQNRILKMVIPCPKNTSPAILRLFTGCMPIAGRIEMLKLRYFWRISHATDDNLAAVILNFKRKEFHTSKIGLIHEVFKLCRKHNCLDVWLKIRRPKENPLNSIKRAVELHYLKTDQEKCLQSTCTYSSFRRVRGLFNAKKYIFDDFFRQIGLFSGTGGRLSFIFALLDRCNFERTCPKCHTGSHNIVQHALGECSRAGLLRLRLQIKLKFYNMPPTIDVKSKEELFSLALSSKRIFLKILCEFLTAFTI